MASNGAKFIPDNHGPANNTAKSIAMRSQVSTRTDFAKIVTMILQDAHRRGQCEYAHECGVARRRLITIMFHLPIGNVANVGPHLFPLLAGLS